MQTIDTLSLVFILLCCVLWILVYCPIIIYHLIRYHSRSANIVYLIRYCNITVIQSIILICKLVIGAFVTMSSIWLFGHYSWKQGFLDAINAYIAALFLYCHVWKFWLLRYNIMLNNIVIGCEWKSIINHKKYAANKTFYAKYKSSFGNMWCTMWIWLVIALLFTTIYVLTRIVYPTTYANASNPYLTELYAGWDYVIPFILLIIIYYKTPKFEDNFYITKEMKYIFICMCIQYASYYVHLTIMGIHYSSASDTTQDIYLFVQSQIAIGTQFASMLISTYWVNSRCDNIIASHRYAIHTISSKLDLNLEQKHCIEIQPEFNRTNGSNDSILPINRPSSTTARKDTLESTMSDAALRPYRTQSGTFRGGLYEALSHSITYNEFMKHLSREFSIECLLSLTEMLQFREYIRAQIESREENDNDNSFTDELLIELPRDIPYSYIVENAEWSNREKAYRIYEKYIQSGSELEINISSEQRSFYHHLMYDYQSLMENEEITDRELMNVFIPCCQQMIHLMVDSMKRFEETAVYNKLSTSLYKQ